MPETTTNRLSLEDVRVSVQRIRDRGEKLVDRLRTDARDLLANAPKVASLDEARKRLEEARKRAEDAVRVVRDLGTRRDAIVSDLVARAVRVLGLAKAEQVARLEARVGELERRIASIGKGEERAA